MITLLLLMILTVQTRPEPVACKITEINETSVTLACPDKTTIVAPRIVAQISTVQTRPEPSFIPPTVTVIVRGRAREMTWERARRLLATTKDPELINGLMRALGANSFCVDTPRCDKAGRCTCNHEWKR